MPGSVHSAIVSFFGRAGFGFDREPFGSKPFGSELRAELLSRTAQAAALLRRLWAAIKDSYVRRTSRKARDWPHKKTEHPPEARRIAIASDTQPSQAEALYVKINAA